MAPTYSNGQEMVSIYLIKIKITTKFFKFAGNVTLVNVAGNNEINASSKTQSSSLVQLTQDGKVSSLKNFQFSETSVI